MELWFRGKKIIPNKRDVNKFNDGGLLPKKDANYTHTFILKWVDGKLIGEFKNTNFIYESTQIGTIKIGLN